MTKSRSGLDKLERRLTRNAGQAIGDFGLIDEGDRVLVGLSGGKDSYTLLLILQLLQRRAPIRFEIEAANLDPGFDGYRTDVVARFAQQRGVPMHQIEAPVAQLIEEHIEEGKTPCPICARMRRGALYTLANRIGANKLALGHHLDDALETLLLNLFYAGSLRSMPPRLAREEGPPVVIRPLCYALERDIAAYAQAQAFPIVDEKGPACDKPDLRRQRIKALLSELEAEHGDLKTQMRKALGNVHHDALYAKRDGGPW